MQTSVQHRPLSTRDAVHERNGQRRRTGQAHEHTRPRSTPADQATLPTLRVEVLLLTALYAGYAAARTLVDQTPAQAIRNGWSVLHVERLLGMDVEQAAIDWLVQWTWLSVLASYAYATLHYVVTLAVLVWPYLRRPAHYRLARSVLVATTCLALVCYWAVPTAPPRLLSPDFVDVLAATAPWGWWGAAASAPRGMASLTNQYAALPSMHVGWALWAGAAVSLLARRRLLRIVAIGYPMLISVVVVVTGNHYVLDAVAGAAAVCLTAFTLERIEQTQVARRTGSHAGRHRDVEGDARTGLLLRRRPSRARRRRFGRSSAWAPRTWVLDVEADGRTSEPMSRADREGAPHAPALCGL